MKLIEGKTYYAQFKNDEIFFEEFTIAKRFKNIPIKVVYKGDFLRIVDKRFTSSKYYDFGFYPERFIMKKNLQLEFDF